MNNLEVMNVISFLKRDMLTLNVSISFWTLFALMLEGIEVACCFALESKYELNKLL